MGVHVNEAEAFSSGGLALHQTDVPLVQVGEGVQSLQYRLYSSGGLHILKYHGWKETQTINTLAVSNCVYI